MISFSLFAMGRALRGQLLRLKTLSFLGSWWDGVFSAKTVGSEKPFVTLRFRATWRLPELSF